MMKIPIVATSHGAQTKTVGLDSAPDAGPNITITVATDQVFELLYVNWPGVQASNTFCNLFVAVDIPWRERGGSYIRWHREDRCGNN